MGIPSPFVQGYSSTIVNWLNSKATLSAMNLDHWRDGIFEIRQNFLSLDLRHVYREKNMCADDLSKDALKIKVVHLTFTEFCEGDIIKEGLLKLF